MAPSLADLRSLYYGGGSAAEYAFLQAAANQFPPVTANTGLYARGQELALARMTQSLAAPAFSNVLAATLGLSAPVAASDIAGVLQVGAELKIEVVIPWFNMGSTATYAVTEIYQDGVAIASEVQSMIAGGFDTLRSDVNLIPTAGPHTYSVWNSLGVASVGNNVTCAPAGAYPTVPYIGVYVA